MSDELESQTFAETGDGQVDDDQSEAETSADDSTRMDEQPVIEEVAEIEQEAPAQDEPAEEMSAGEVEQASSEMVSEGDRPYAPVSPRKGDDFSRDTDDVPDFSLVPAVEGEHADGRAWYVVHCYSGYENKVRHNLEQRIESMGMKNQIFDVVVPTEEEIEVKEGKRRTVERRVFPGYILVNMVLGEESWYVVRNTPGVTSFVGQGNTPLPLRPEEVSQIVKRMEAEAPRIKVTFKQGERVRIVDGPFNDFRGTVSEIDMERAKVRVMVNFFGRETPVELDFLQVEKA